MKIKPFLVEICILDDHIKTYEDILQCCDSYIAVLTKEQLDEWVAHFKKVVTSDTYMNSYMYGSCTLAFQVGDDILVTVSDAGGEYLYDVFREYCEANDIDCQFVIDSLDCDGIDLDEIYTGEIDNNDTLLKLLHQIYN